MLLRAARALESAGSGVFTMDLVNGHYLSNRRASMQERIFKYADKGYGIRLLPSYIPSLATRETASDTDKPRNPVDSARRCPDLASVAAEERDWTTQELASSTLEYGRTPSLRALISRGYRASRCLNGFQIFIRCVALWEHGRRGDVSIERDLWASTGYQDAMTTCDDAPPTLQYKWDEDFDMSEFHDEANATEIANWAETDFDQRLLWHGASVSSSGDGLDAYQRMTCAPTVDSVLSKKNDIMLQDQAGLPETKVLIPAVRGFNFLWNPNPRADGLFFRCIGKDLMWQKRDRRVDEIFEVLYAFRRVNEQLRHGDAYQASRSARNSLDAWYMTNLTRLRDGCRLKFVRPSFVPRLILLGYP
ncbi:hypothetical protein C8R47DRAFT_1214666 [Mycena vitilis]|nr:hypothetical protein C8R47DRAFT_1214666 [Mycena vitilis]